MIDIVFLLLVYFLLSSNFLVEHSLPVQVPKAKAAVPVRQKELTIVIQSQGQVLFQGQLVSLDELLALLREKLALPGVSRHILVKADRKVLLEEVVQVMDVARSAGANRLSLAAEKRFD